MILVKIPSHEVVNFYENAEYSIAGLELLDKNLPNLKIISRENGG